MIANSETGATKEIRDERVRNREEIVAKSEMAPTKEWIYERMGCRWSIGDRPRNGMKNKTERGGFLKCR